MYPYIKNRLLCLSLIAAIFGTIAFSSGHFENPDAHLRLSQSFSLLDAKSFQVNSDTGNIKHGNIAYNSKGEKYSVYAPGQIILFTPGSYIANQLAIPGILHKHYISELLNSFIGPFIHLLTAITIFFSCRGLRRSRYSSITIATVFAVATFNFPLSRDGYEHTYEVFFISLSFAIALYGNNKNRPPSLTHDKYLLSGLSLAIGVLFRPTAILALPGLLLLCNNRTNAMRLLAAIIPCLVLLAAYNYFRFGNPIETGYTQAWLSANPELIGSSGFSLSSIIKHSAALWLSPGKGMFIFSPVLLAVLFSVHILSNNNRRAVAAILLTVLIYTLFYGSNFAWHGSAWSWGPRYLAALTSLVILLVPTLTTKHLTGIATIFLAFISILIQAGAILVNYKRHLLVTILNDPSAYTDGRIYYNFDLSPVLALPKNIFYILNRSFTNTNIYNFITPGPWKNESRTVDIQAMLNNSMDLNVFDLWWIRIAYYPIPETLKYIALLFGLVAFAGFIISIASIIKQSR